MKLWKSNASFFPSAITIQIHIFFLLSKYSLKTTVTIQQSKSNIYGYTEERDFPSAKQSSVLVMYRYFKLYVEIWRIWKLTNLFHTVNYHVPKPESNHVKTTWHLIHTIKAIQISFLSEQDNIKVENFPTLAKNSAIRYFDSIPGKSIVLINKTNN